MLNAGLYSRQGRAIPLRGVEVVGEVLGAHARVKVRQRYQNAEPKPIEAVYTFPLPSDATLVGFAMTCEGRRVEGVVKEREEAFRTYDDAVVAGHGAALVEQERANVFTASVGNLLPGEDTEVEVEYLQRVQADEGALRWMIPTLVAPRYIPGSATGDRTADGYAAPTDRVPDADRISPRQGAVDYGLSLDLVFDVGREVEVESPSHRVTVTREGARTRVRFSQGEVALDRDVVVTVRGVRSGPLTTATAHRVAGGAGTVAVGVVPDLATSLRRPPRQDVVFLIDTSGSMEGDSITEARDALRLCLRHLREGDRFNVIAFSSSWQAFSRELLPFGQRSLEQADRWVRELQADGGTELLEPLEHAVKAARDGLVVLLTDGQVGNEDEILRRVLAARGRARVYSFGIGTNVSDALLRDLGKHTGGAVELIHPGERIDEKVVAQFSRALAPRVTEVSVRFTGVDVGEVAPSSLPDLVDGEPWTLFARYDAPGVGCAEVLGLLEGEPFTLEVPLELPSEASRPALPKLWASERIRDLEAAVVTGRRAESMKDRVVKLAVEHGVVCRYTAFVVVETRTGARRASGQPETRNVPVNVPAGWAMFDQKPAPDVVTRGPMKKKSAPRPVTAGPMVARARRAVPAAAPPPPAQAPSPRGGSWDYLEQERAAAPSVGGAPKLAKEDSVLFSLRESLKMELADGFSRAEDDAPCEAEESVCMDEAPELSPEPAPATTEEQPPAARKDKGEGVVSLLTRQLASGLWDEPGAKGADPARSLRATARALWSLKAEGIDGAHALHGAQVRKAVDAVLSAVPSLADADAACLAVGAAWLVTTGHRTRRSLEALVNATPALASLVPLLGDLPALEARLRQLDPSL